MTTAQYEKLSDYERHALEEIDKWRNPPSSWIRSIVKTINEPIDWVGQKISETPYLGEVLQKVAQGCMTLANDAAQFTVRADAIFEEYRDDGHEVHGLKDIADLDLEQVDKTVGYLSTKYIGLVAFEGAGTGLVGAPGLVVDIPVFFGACLRAIGEYATYHGFDVDLQKERIYILSVMSMALSPTDASKAAAMVHLTKISGEIGRRATWKELERNAFVKMLQELFKALGIRLTKAKLAQVVPAVGAVAGGGFNAYIMSNVCEAAHYLYRERFIIEKVNRGTEGEPIEPIDVEFVEA